MQIGKQIQQQRADPRRPLRIDRRRKAEHGQTRNNDTYANHHFRNAGVHGNGRFSHPLHTAPENKQEIEQNKEQRQKFQIDHRTADRLLPGKHQLREEAMR